MRVSDDGRTVSAFDIIAPKVSVSKKVHAYILPRRKCCNFLTLHCASYIMSRLELWSEEAKRRNAWMWSSRGNPSETPREKASWLSRAIILDLALNVLLDQCRWCHCWILCRIQELGLPHEQYEWYIDLRKHGSVKHSGFSLDIEKMVMTATGLADVKDAIPFPRVRGHAKLWTRVTPTWVVGEHM